MRSCNLHGLLHTAAKKKENFARADKILVFFSLNLKYRKSSLRDKPRLVSPQNFTSNQLNLASFASIRVNFPLDRDLLLNRAIILRDGNKACCLHCQAFARCGSVAKQSNTFHTREVGTTSSREKKKKISSALLSVARNVNPRRQMTMSA